jgi:hypothetical protein
VSGESRVVLEADPDGVVVRLVNAIGEVADAPIGRWTLVGGLAVMVRLTEAHRPTRDVDAVAETADGESDAVVSVVAEHTGGEATNATTVVLADGTKVDVIATAPIVEAALPDDDNERLFILAHAFALATAEVLDICVVDRLELPARASVPVATPGTLVAMKLHALQSRRRDPAKLASDAYDIYRLLATHDREGAVAAQLRDGPHDVASLSRNVLASTLRDDAGRWSRRLRTDARGAAMGSIEAEDLEVVASLCVDAIDQGSPAWRPSPRTKPS